MENSTHNQHTILYIFIALVVGILIGTYIPKMLHGQSAQDEGGRVYQSIWQSPSAGLQNSANKGISGGCKYDDQCPLNQKCSASYPNTGTCIPMTTQ